MKQNGMLAIPFTEGDGSGVLQAGQANPEGVPVYITRCIVHVTTKADAAATVNVGIGSTSTTADDTLLDGLDVGTAAGTFDNIKNAGANGLAGKVWPAAEFLTIAEATGDVTGLVGTIYVEYKRLGQEDED